MLASPACQGVKQQELWDYKTLKGWVCNKINHTDPCYTVCSLLPDDKNALVLLRLVSAQGTQLPWQLFYINFASHSMQHSLNSLILHVPSTACQRWEANFLEHSHSCITGACCCDNMSPGTALPAATDSTNQVKAV